MATKNYSIVTIRLIRDDMINRKLVQVLSHFYPDASNFRLDLQEAIFELMELDRYEKIDELKSWYNNTSQKVEQLSINALDDLVLELYAGLKAKYHGKN